MEKEKEKLNGNGNSLRILIFNFLRKHREGINLTTIEKGLNRTRQSILYNLNSMIKEGIIIRNENNYLLQDFLYSEGIEDLMLDVFTNILENCSEFNCNETKLSTNEIIVNCIALFSSTFSDNVKKLLLE